MNEKLEIIIIIIVTIILLAMGCMIIYALYDLNKQINLKEDFCKDNKMEFLFEESACKYLNDDGELVYKPIAKHNDKYVFVRNE